MRIRAIWALPKGVGTLNGVVAIVVLLAGMFVWFSCEDGDTHPVRDAWPSGDSEPLLAKFTVCPLPEYDLLDGDTVRGLGGRWISLRYVVIPGTELPTKLELEKRFRDAMAEDGWREAPAPCKIGFSKVWGQSDDDLQFHREPRGDELEHSFYNLRVHIGEKARSVFLYCEVGW
jgi:hypothetical protein